MSNEVVKREPSRVAYSLPQGQELAQLMDLCRTLGTCPYYIKMGAGGVLAVALTARELRLPLMMCLNGGMYTFDGKVSLSAQLMNMMIVNAGHRADVLRLDDQGCKIRFWRCDRKSGHGDTFEYEYTLEMAQKAGLLGKNNWKTNPRDMCYSRALSGGGRKFMPDSLMNCYAFGEIVDANFSDDHLVNVMPEVVVEGDNSVQVQETETKVIEYVSKEDSNRLQELIDRLGEEGTKIAEFIKSKLSISSLDQVPADKLKGIQAYIEKESAKLTQQQEQSLT